jgi:hypothetical protein
VANDGSENSNRRGPLVAVAAVVLLVAIGLFLAHELSASGRLQDCVLSGRTNCAPLERQR